MSVRRTVLIPFLALLAALTLVAGACSSGDKSDEGSIKTATTEKAEGDDTGSTDTTEATKSDEEFSAAIDDARQQIKDAEGDPCKVIETFQSLGSSLGTPTSADQRKQTTELAIDFYTALADAAPEDLSAEADQVRSTVKEIQKEGEESNWSEEFMTEPKAVKDNEAFTEATTKLLTTLSSGCTTTTAP